jgi:hypothetical protein
MNKIEEIKLIHNNIEIKDKVLILNGKIEGNNLEKITKLWNHKIKVKCLIGTYNHNKNIEIVNNNNKKLLI